MNRQSLTISSHSVVRDRDAWRNSPTTSSPVVPMPRPGPTSPTFPAHATLPSSQFIAHIPQRSFSADTRAILREQQRRDPWSVDASNWSEFEGAETAPSIHSLSLPRSGSSVHSLFNDEFGPRTHSFEMGRSHHGTSFPQTQPNHWSHGNQSYEFDQDDDMDDGTLIQSYDTAEVRSVKNGISLMRIGSKKGTKKSNPSARSNSFSQSSYGPSSDLPKERRHTLSVSLSRTPSKRSSEPRTEEIYAPDDGRIDPLSKRPWWSNPSRAPPKIVRAKDDLPRDPPPGLLARSLSLPVKPYQSERDRHSFSGTFSGAGSQMRGKIHEGVASGVTGLGGAIQGVGDKVLGGRRVKTDDVGMQEHAREAYYEDGYANPGYVEDSDYYSPSRAKGAGFRHSMSGASGVGQRIIHGMEMFETGVDTAGERFAATNVGGKVVGAGTSVATGLGNMASKVSSGTSTDRFSGNESGGKRASIGSSFASGVSNAGSKISSGASGLSDRIAHNNVGGRIAGVGSNVVSGVSSMGSKIAHSNVGEKITGVSSNVATGLSTVGSKIAHSNVRGKIVGVSSSVATGVSNVGSKIAIGASGFGDKITHSHVGAKIGGAGSSIAMGVSSVGSKVASGVGSVGTKLGGLVRGKAGREE